METGRRGAGGGGSHLNQPVRELRHRHPVAGDPENPQQPAGAHGPGGKPRAPAGRVGSEMLTVSSGKLGVVGNLETKLGGNQDRRQSVRRNPHGANH